MISTAGWRASWQGRVAETAKALERAILAAHASGDGARLAALYRQAGLGFLEAGETDAGAFYLTNAYIFALEVGDPLAEDLHARLVALGREA